jgi:WD40 repeat protein
VIDGGDIVKMYNHALDEVASYNPRGSANSVAVSPDGRTVAIATDTGSVLLWDMADIPSTTQSATPVARSLIENAAPMASVAFSPDGKTLAASSIDGLVRLWEVSDGATREIKTIAPLYSLTPATPTGTREVYPDNILPLDYHCLLAEGKTLAFVEPDGLVVFRDLVYSHSTPGTAALGITVR